MHDIFDSRTGSWLVTLYALVAIMLAGYSFTCAWDGCSALVVAPVMPWAYLLRDTLGLNLSVTMYPLLLLLNASALYSLGVAFEWWRQQMNEK